MNCNTTHYRANSSSVPGDPTFTATGSLSIARYTNTATLLSNGKVLITGGYSGTAGDLSTAELYDPATMTFSATGSMSIARYVHTATLLSDGAVLIVGGANSAAILSSAELY